MDLDDDGWVSTRIASVGAWLGFQADVHRRIVFMPRFEGGRRILPALHEIQITGFRDEEGEDIVEDIDMNKAAYAVCHTYSDDGDHEVVVALDFKGVTIH